MLSKLEPCADCDGRGRVDDYGWPLRRQRVHFTVTCESCRGLGCATYAPPTPPINARASAWERPS